MRADFDLYYIIQSRKIKLSKECEKGKSEGDEDPYYT